VFPASQSWSWGSIVVLAEGCGTPADRLTFTPDPSRRGPFSLRRAGFPSRRKDAAQADQRHLTGTANATYPSRGRQGGQGATSILTGRVDLASGDSSPTSNPSRHCGIG
jgi:hypothetical protein